MTGRQSDWLVRQLPYGMQAEDFFVRFVSIFQEEAGTLLQHADNLPYLGDVDLTPPAMVRELAQWLGRGIDPSYPEDVQRRILRTAATTLQWRGTATGLTRIVELYSGGPVHVSESGGVYAEGQAPDGPAWVVIEVESTGSLAEPDFLRLVLDEVPAHVHVEIRVADRRIWPVLSGAAEEGELAS
ncbi:MAG TPA: phage tail protein [Cellulomonas sp.]|nr:phage tail protein [Cellulomonas sp.]